MPSYETPEPISAAINLPAGTLRLLTTGRGATSVEVQPSDPEKKSDVQAVEQTRVEYANGKLKVKAPRQRGSQSGMLDIVVELPDGSDLEIRSSSLDLRSKGRLGELRCRSASGDIDLDVTGPLDLDTASGDVTVNRVAGRIDVQLGSGDVHIHEIDGSGCVKSSSGDLRVGNVTGELRLNAASGDIALSVAHADVQAKAVTGNIVLGEVARGSVAAETSTGQLKIGIRDTVPAWLDLHSQTGSVHNALATTDGPEQGEETVKVEARSLSGDIVIHRS
ncbi:DUF4097 family beta strand repeat-containing protein [Streptomyces sp. 8N114]|uniref:DUF4097 family beta strand repeat-containing protein n=1 Tax=Streptomyces sp. 8N114 TaxID=3457419 RepID=UPI003FD1C799